LQRRILIDASGATEKIQDYVELLRKELANQKCALQEILITHWHPDHTEGVQPIIKNMLNGQACKVSKHRMVGDQPEYDTETKYTYITEKDLIQTEGATLKPIFTPGHACDHLAFYFEEENSLFSGITILMERIFTDRI
jgi:ribonuclease/clavin/mitogillin